MYPSCSVNFIKEKFKKREKIPVAGLIKRKQEKSTFSQSTKGVPTL